MGDRIAIMKDGEIVQTGTAEDIVTAPANDYVADFVENVPKGGFITARQIMGTHGADAGGRNIAPDAPLNEVLAKFAEDQTPMAVTEGSVTLGYVTVANALAALTGKDDT